MEEYLQPILGVISEYVPNLLAALAILVVGWIAAIIISAIARGIIRRTSMSKKLSEWITSEGEKPVAAERYFGKVVFYILMLFVVIAFFQALGLTVITEPLNNMLNELFVYAPRFLGAALLLVTAWILAKILKFVITKVLTAVKLDQRFADKSEKGKSVELTSIIANSVYWLIFLLFLPAILSSLQMVGLLGPVQAMLDEILQFLPNIFTAIVVLLMGWFVANIIRKVVSNLLAAIGINSLSDKVGLGTLMGKSKLSDLLGLIVYVLVFIPVLLIAMDALKLEAITLPVTNMLNVILESLPLIFAAFLIIAISYVVAKLVSKLIGNLLAGLKFDDLMEKLGIMDKKAKEANKASEAVGYIVLVAILAMAVIEAFQMLGFGLVSEIVTAFTVFAGNVVLGLIIFGLGLFLSNIVATKILTKETSQLKLMATIARVAILFIAGAMALQQMGVGAEIINMAFGLILGAIAIAVAIAFGIGGRDAAAKQIEKWKGSF